MKILLLFLPKRSENEIKLLCANLTRKHTHTIKRVDKENLNHPSTTIKQLLHKSVTSFEKLTEKLMKKDFLSLSCLVNEHEHANILLTPLKSNTDSNGENQITLSRKVERAIKENVDCRWKMFLMKKP